MIELQDPYPGGHWMGPPPSPLLPHGGPMSERSTMLHVPGVTQGFAAQNRCHAQWSGLPTEMHEGLGDEKP
jgi:hypothetical protein